MCGWIALHYRERCYEAGTARDTVLSLPSKGYCIVSTTRNLASLLIMRS
jgi:hypothetical protein